MSHRNISRAHFFLFKSIFFLLLIFLCSDSFSQKWVQMMQDPNANFYETQKEFEEYWAPIIKAEEQYYALNPNAPKIKRPGWKAFKRWEEMMEPRVYPSGTRTESAIAIKKYVLSQIASQTISPPIPPTSFSGGSGSSSSSSTAGAWTSLGPDSVPPGGGIGRVNCITVDPTDSNKIWIGAPSGGLWKTTNGGNSWTTNTDFLAMIGVSDVVIDSFNTNIMYLATGDGDASDVYSVGVLKSIDGGLTWDTTGLVFPYNWFVTIRKLLIHPDSSNILLAATTAGIYRTTDAGINWTQNAFGDFRDMEFKPGNPNVVYTAESGNFFRSTDNGATFTNITSGLPASNVGRMSIAVTPADTNYVYILASKFSDYGFEGFYRSTDGGTNFTTRASSPNILGWNDDGSGSGGQGWYDLACAASPTDKDLVFIGGINIWKTSNGGTSWTCNAHWYGASGLPYIHADQHVLEFKKGSDSTLFSGNDGGIFKTNNLGGTWTDKSHTLGIAQMYRLGTSKSNAAITITGHQDNATNIKNGSWSYAIGGDGMECIIDPISPSIMYAEIYYGQLYKSTNGGASFSVITNYSGVNENAKGAWVTPYIMNPQKNSTLLLGKAQVFRSRNSGSSWTQVGTISGGSTNLKALAMAPSDSNYIYAAKNEKLYVSTNGTSFTDRTAGLPIGIDNISYISVCDTNPSKVYMSFYAYSGANKVMVSLDAGVTWSNYSTGLPDFPINCIVYEKNSLDGLYVGTDIGVYYRNNTMSSWQSFMSGLPNVIVRELEIQYSSGKIRAATYGRGLWESDLHTDFIAGFTGSPLTVCTGGTVTFTDTTNGTVTTHAWDFGTGASPATAATAGPHAVTYASSGLKTVSLIVTGPEGTDTATFVNYVNVITPGPNGGAGTWTWTGSASVNWFDPCNWNLVSLPDNLSDVVLPGGTPFEPTITGSAAACNSIQINSSSGAILTIDTSGGGLLNLP